MGGMAENITMTVTMPRFSDAVLGFRELIGNLAEKIVNSTIDAKFDMILES